MIWTFYFMVRGVVKLHKITYFSNRSGWEYNWLNITRTVIGAQVKILNSVRSSQCKERRQYSLCWRTQLPSRSREWAGSHRLSAVLNPKTRFSRTVILTTASRSTDQRPSLPARIHQVKNVSGLSRSAAHRPQRKLRQLGSRRQPHGPCGQTSRRS